MKAMEWSDGNARWIMLNNDANRDWTKHAEACETPSDYDNIWDDAPAMIRISGDGGCGPEDVCGSNPDMKELIKAMISDMQEAGIIA